MTDLNHQIHLALRTAAGHARAARDVEVQADKQYEMKMKSAGAAVWEAWTLTVRALPENQGRKIDDKALVRIYESTKPRPWWDKQLATVKVDGKPADREWAKRTVQWHLDPDAARARRLQHAARLEGARRKVKESQARPHTPNSGRPSAPSSGEVRKVAKAIEGYGGGDWHDSSRVPQPENTMLGDSIARLLERARAAARGMNPVQLAEAETMLKELVETWEGGL
jgi:hypothetical protein